MSNKKSKKALRRPSEVYQLCPVCQTTNLIRLNVDVLCGECDWISCEEHVECGGMDNLFVAFRDHFSLEDDVSIEGIKAQTIEDAATDPHKLSVEPLETNEPAIIMAIA